MTVVAFATELSIPELTPDDQRAVHALERLGIQVVPAVWDSEDVEWERFNAVVIRSTWDYYRRYGEFLAWLEMLEETGVRVLNPLPVLRWNSTKTYLRELEATGVPVAPTLWTRFNDRRHLREESASTGWKDVVLKPVISAGGYLTVRVGATDTEEILPEYPPGAELMVQPFIPSVVEEGELSLLFFSGRFSHAALKRAASGEFRIQYAYGGTAEGVNAPPEAVNLAEEILNRARVATGVDPLYARVDLARSPDRGWALMELELLEPSLYFEQAPGSEERFAEALGVCLKG